MLINLVRNAVEAMAGSADARGRDLDPASPATMVEIEVADSGAGIAPEHLDSLFSEFMTTKSGGMGLGLPISRTIVEAHGGKIWAENRPRAAAPSSASPCRAARRAQKGRRRRGFNRAPGTLS